MQIKPITAVQSIFFIIITCFSASAIYADEYDLLPVPQNRKMLKLNGSVIGMKEQKYVLAKDTAIYNTIGTISLDDKFVVVRSEEAAFDVNGNILNLKTSSLIDVKRNKMKDSLRLFYYKNDRLTGIRNMADNKPTDSFEFHYLRKGLLDYYRLFDVNGDVEYKMTYVYKGRKVFTIRKKDKGNFATAMIKLKYKDDRLSEWQYYDDQFRNTETRKFSYKENKDGNFNESYAVFNTDGTLKGGMTLLRDTSGNILEQSVVDSGRTVTAYFQYEYDTHQNKIKEKIYLGLEQANVENRYTYDTHNNWTRKEIFTNDVLTAIVTRSYNYGE
jgi:hypothetical protein